MAAVTLALGVGGVCIVIVARGVFIHEQESQAAAHAQLIGKVVLGRMLTAADFTKPTAARVRSLDRLFRQDVLTGSTVAATIYAPDGRAIYATEPRFRAKAVENAVPIRFGEGPTAGTVVISTSYAGIEHAAAKAYVPVSVVLELLLAVLLAALVPAVRRGIGGSRQHVLDVESYALRDMLTGLPTRGLFEDRLTHALAQAQRDGSAPAVMVIDLNRFKEINDMLGHAAGDALLREIALRLTRVLRDADTVARIGGDEFAIVLADGSSTAVHETVLRMQQAVEEPVVYDGMSLAVGVSIGVALHPQHGTSVAGLLHNADVAMYQAKRAGLGHVVFDPGTSTAGAERLALATDLSGALDRNEIVLHYQPTVTLATNEIEGVEALLRWNHPVQGPLPADRFMLFAEQAGVRRQLHEFALEQAIRQAGTWRRAGLTLSIAVNLDASSLVDRDLSGRLERLLEEEGVEGSQIEAEIAETSLLGDVERVTVGATALAALGVILVVDDFGADQTSLNSLAYLPIERLKIDRALLNRALDAKRDRIVLGGVVDLAHQLGLRVVVAGVESDEAERLLRELQVDFAQGYHLGAPMTPAALERLLPSPREAAA